MIGSEEKALGRAWGYLQRPGMKHVCKFVNAFCFILIDKKTTRLIRPFPHSKIADPLSLLAELRWKLPLKIILVN
ncbi:hypothetical protein [Candidatus Nitrospira neomarina]|uniref:Uncharacterized protein n=1 Tax=Candidatus Nitrospira neomarina TaxID=3020899 RepID=A0AA96GLT2_9BACT|nr:hypothetical protein [Candidatus Nitrospira neomarina]WNM61488.1 hypothetical protein PQG83_17270 [Candidatus Nitrospira neomarina]